MSDRSVEEPILVALRARPFSPKEHDDNGQLVLEVSGKRASLTDPSNPSAIKDFAYEHCFWSVNGARGPQADNGTVFQQYAYKLVDNAFAGYNSTFISYGATGSGKTFGLFGSKQSSSGLFQLVCSAILARSNNSSPDTNSVDPSNGTTLDMSCITIYNEEVTDLLSGLPKPNGGEKVTVLPAVGACVPTASRHVIKTESNISELVDDMLTVKALHCVKKNINTSRLALVVTLTLQLTTVDEVKGGSYKQTSTISFVDMPGSEYSGRTVPSAASTSRDASTSGNNATSVSSSSSSSSSGSSSSSSSSGPEASVKSSVESKQQLFKASIPPFAKKVNKSIIAFVDCVDHISKSGTVSNSTSYLFTSSTLTTLLQNALAGNSKTLVLVNVSPAASDYDETLAVLRIADKLKRLRTRPSPTYDSLISRALLEVNDDISRLKSSPTYLKYQASSFSALSSRERDEVAMVNTDIERLEKYAQYLTSDIAKLNEHTTNFKEKRVTSISQSGVTTLSSNTDSTVPYLVALHADPSVSKVLRYKLKLDNKARICRPNVLPQPTSDDVCVESLQLLTHHATLAVDAQGECALQALNGARVFINGKAVVSGSEPVKLQTGDRILLGAHLVFLFEGAGSSSSNSSNMIGDMTWEGALQETNRANISALIGLDAVAEQQIVEEEKEKNNQRVNALKKELDECREGRRAGEINFTSSLSSITEKIMDFMTKNATALSGLEGDALAKARQEIDAKQVELDKEKEKLVKSWEKKKNDFSVREAQLVTMIEEAGKWDNDEAKQKRKRVAEIKQKEKEAALMVVLPMVNEANALCTELRQTHLRSGVKLITNKNEINNYISILGPTGVGIKVTNSDTDTEVVYSIDQFRERLIVWNTVYESYVQYGELNISGSDGANVDDDASNPFSVQPIGPQLLGTCHVLLQPLTFLLPVIERVPIINYKGETMGKLDVRILPLPRGFKKGDNEEDIYFDEESLDAFLNDSFNILFKFKKCTGLPKKMTKDVFIKYRLPHFDDEEKEEEVSDPAEQSLVPRIDYKRLLRIDLLTKEMIEAFRVSVLEIKVFGSLVDDIIKADPQWSKLANIIERGTTETQAAAERALKEANEALRTASTNLAELLKSKLGSDVNDNASSNSSSNSTGNNVADGVLGVKHVNPDLILKKIEELFDKQKDLVKQRMNLEAKLIVLEQSASRSVDIVNRAQQQQEKEIEKMKEREERAREREARLEKEITEERKRMREADAKKLTSITTSGTVDDAKAAAAALLVEQKLRDDEATDKEIIRLRVQLASTSEEAEEGRIEIERLRAALDDYRQKYDKLSEERDEERGQLRHQGRESVENIKNELEQQLHERDKEKEDLEKKLEDEWRNKMEAVEAKLKEREVELKKLMLEKEYEEEREKEREQANEEHEAEVERLRDLLRKERLKAKQKSGVCTIL